MHKPYGRGGSFLRPMKIFCVHGSFHSKDKMDTLTDGTQSTSTLWRSLHWLTDSSPPQRETRKRNCRLQLVVSWMLANALINVVIWITTPLKFYARSCSKEGGLRNKPFISPERFCFFGGKSKEFLHFLRFCSSRRMISFLRVWLPWLSTLAFELVHSGSVTCVVPRSVRGSLFLMNYGDLNFNYPWKRLLQVARRWWRKKAECEKIKGKKAHPEKSLLPPFKWYQPTVFLPLYEVHTLKWMTQKNKNVCK